MGLGMSLCTLGDGIYITGTLGDGGMFTCVHGGGVVFVIDTLGDVCAFTCDSVCVKM